MDHDADPPAPSGRGRYVVALDAADKRRFIRAGVVGFLGWILVVAGRFLAFPNKHGVRLDIGWALMGVGLLAVLVVLGVSWRLVLRGRGLLRATTQNRSVASAVIAPIGQLRSDGAEFWNGTGWVSATSADGEMRWNGERWASTKT
jgi:membrane-bound ClpP family serine protease